MAGTKTGGDKARNTNILYYGEDYYRRIGKMGGQKSRNGGFASSKLGKDGLTGRERARIAGQKGGRISRLPKKQIELPFWERTVAKVKELI